jgi:hypothetical protein
MSLNFGAVSSHVNFSIGNAANLSNGAFTMLALWKPAGTSGLIAGFNGATQRRAYLMDFSPSPGHVFGDGDFSSGDATSITAGDFWWLGISKAAGAATYRCHARDFTTSGAWQHGVSTGAGTHTDPGVSNAIQVGSNSETAAAQGDVAVSGIWTSQLSDAAIEAACTSKLADLMAATPAWAARYMQSAPTNIQDLTGGGGNETGRTGTITATADPVGYDFTLGGVAKGSLFMPFFK